MNSSCFSLLRVCCFILLILAFASAAFAGHGGDRPVKKGILLAAFGTTVPEAKPALDNIDKLVRAAFPGVEIRWAYTAAKIRKILKEQGQETLSVSQALADMAADGFTHVAVQSLHTIPGEEFHGLLKESHAFSGLPKGIKKVLVGFPLLSTTEDLEAATDALFASFPKERKKDEAILLMGHGTHHPGNVYYAGLQYHVWKKDPNVFVGTVEGAPVLDDILPVLKERGIKKVYLQPFMAVAGDHATNDMAGGEPDSWKSILEKEGFTCVSVLKGTGEIDSIVAIWVDHLKKAFAHFE